MSHRQWAFYVLLTLYGFMMLYLLVSSVRASNTLGAVLVTIFIGPVLLIPLRVAKLRKLGLHTSKLKLWLFGAGETLILCCTASFAAQSWVRMQRGGWMYGIGWVFLSIFVGLLFAVILYEVDGRRYRKLGVASQTASPMRAALTFMVRAVLIAALICVGVPPLFVGLSAPVVGLLVCVSARLYLGIRDHRRMIKLRNRTAA